MNSGDHTREPKRPDYLVPLIRDILSVGAVATLLICVHYLATPFRRGFYCDDETIRYPHKESTVPSSVCYLFGSGLNVLLILIFEYILLQEERNSTNNRNSGNEFQFRLYIRNVYCRLIVWLFGAVSSELLTDISKFTAGRLRPHFIDVCRPHITSSTGQMIILDDYCKDPENRYKYITEYSCFTNDYKLKDIRLSFMSGHSSYSAYSAAFAVFYLQSVMNVAKLGLIKPALQVMIISTAFYTGLTRVSDYKHHWQDVLAGLVQGTLTAGVVSTYLYPAFYKTYTKYVRSSNSRVGENFSGEELSRVSY